MRLEGYEVNLKSTIVNLKSTIVPRYPDKSGQVIGSKQSTRFTSKNTFLCEFFNSYPSGQRGAEKK